jgi:hypothetical protein
MNLVANVIIPPLLAKRPRDRRGYPIPYIVMRDKKKNNKPLFTVNDARMVRRCLSHNRCGLCGEKLAETIFFVGGPGCAFSPVGAYVDPPMHKECVEYALQVCPFLALRSYKGYAPTYVYEMEGVAIDTGVLDGKPEIFVVKETHGFVNMQDFLQPRLCPTDQVSLSVWKDGKQIEDWENNQMVEEAIASALGGVEQAKAAQVMTTVRSPAMTGVRALAHGLALHD